MENVIIILLLIYNVYLGFYLLKEKRPSKNEIPTSTTPIEQRSIVGKSHFKMTGKTTQESNAEPQTATFSDNENVRDSEVTFAEETGKHTPVQVPNDKLDDVFSDVRITDVPVDYKDDETDENEEIQGYATGVSFEEIGRAVSIAGHKEATQEERHRAGQVFSEMEGNDLFTQLVQRSSKRAKAITTLMDSYLNDSSLKEKQEETVETENNTEVPSDITQFDIREFV